MNIITYMSQNVTFVVREQLISHEAQGTLSENSNDTTRLASGSCLPSKHQQGLTRGIWPRYIPVCIHITHCTLNKEKLQEISRGFPRGTCPRYSRVNLHNFLLDKPLSKSNDHVSSTSEQGFDKMIR